MIKQVMEWVIDEVAINTSYNHVVICSNKSYNSYKIIFILHEYIYVYINHFYFLSPLCLPVVKGNMPLQFNFTSQCISVVKIQNSMGECDSAR